MPKAPATRSLHPAALALLLILALTATACKQKASVMTQPYGKLANNQTAQLITLTNKNGVTAELTDFGATLVSLKVPDSQGNFADICIGYDTLAGWVKDGSYMGATVGRYGNRIANGKFTLDGKTYTLATNNGPHHLHGGNAGFNKKTWDAQPIKNQDSAGVKFTYVSEDGEEGYPGKLTSSVTYLLNDNNELIVKFEATTDKATVVNLVHHTYWNLTGDPSQSILDHELTLYAQGYAPTDAKGIPLGKVQPVEGTPMDFRFGRRVGDRINNDFEQLKFGKGYDHSWAVDGKPGTLRPAARLVDPNSGRVMEIFTDQPAIQFYTGNYMDGSSTGKGGIKHNHRTGLCLETQVFPDSPNQPSLSNSVLKPGETYTHTMVHKFSTK